MIHIRHTPAAELARQRIRRAIRCVPLALLPGLGAACWAFNSQLIVPVGDIGCNFHGVAFIPQEQHREDTPAPAHSPHQPAQEMPHPVLNLALQQPEFALPELQPLLREEGDAPDETALLETDAASLCPSENTTPAPTKAMASAPKAKEPAETFTPPAYLDCPQPSYPPLLRQRRVQGVVGVRISVAADGTPTDVEIAAPSGNAALDRHTRSWILHHWRFTPAHRNGHPMAARVDTHINFVLRA